MKTIHRSTDDNAATFVLVEEEKAIRDEWLRIASTKNLFLMTYPDAEWFLNDMRNGVFSGREKFFLDQDFGEVRGVGLRLARIIKAQWPNAYASLVTAYPKFLFRREIAAGLLNDAFGKYPAPFENPAFTTWEQQYEQEIWVPLTSSLHGCNG